MEMSDGPMQRRRQVASRLRAMREAAGRSMEEAAQQLDCSVAKISRIETGRLLARLPDVRSLLEFYGVPAQYREELLELVRRSRQKGWWDAYTDVLDSEAHQTYLGTQDGATTIVEYQPYLIPSLAQTPDYAYAALAALPGATGTDVDRRVDLRTATQRAVLDRLYPPLVRFLIDEAALRRQAGSPMLHHLQLAHLVELAKHDHITVQVVPLESGLTVPHGFILLEFTDGAAAYIDLAHDAYLETKSNPVTFYTAAVDQITALAMTPEDSTDYLNVQLARTAP